MTQSSDRLRKSIGGRKRPPGISNGVIANGWIFLSAVRGEGDDIKSQARDALEQVKVLLEGVGATMDHVVQATLYLKDVTQRPVFDEVWIEYFGTENPPARTGIQTLQPSTTPDGDSLFAFDCVCVAP